jgi:hypothetical protein
MKMSSPAESCLLIGLIVGTLLWWSGSKTSAIIIFAAEALAWAGLYAATSAKDD